MREIKFRAWDKKTNAFYVPIYEAYKGNLFDINLSMNGQIMARDSEYKTGDMNRFICTDEYQDRFELMQYTGLKDIYESDIIQWNVRGSIKIGTVYWADCGWWIKDSRGGNKTHLSHASGLKVLGNIHENPELLTN